MAVEAVGKRGEEHSGGGQGDSGGRSGEENRTQDGIKVQNQSVLVAGILE